MQIYVAFLAQTRNALSNLKSLRSTLKAHHSPLITHHSPLIALRSTLSGRKHAREAIGKLGPGSWVPGSPETWNALSTFSNLKSQISNLYAHLPLRGTSSLSLLGSTLTAITLCC